MRSTMLALCWLTAAAALGAEPVSQEELANWPQWRGPLATGMAPAARPPLTWDEQTNVKWKVKVPGDSTATPIVWGDRIFLTTAIKTDREGEPEPVPEPKNTAGTSRGLRFGNYGITNPKHYYQFVVMCLDRKSGRTVWQDVAAEAVPHEGHHPDGSFASASPSTDGRQVYVSFGSRGVYCYSVAGEKRWSRDLGKMLIFNTFGEGASPVVHGDSVIVNWDHQGESFIVSLDSQTGDTRWKVDRDETSTWGTPLVVDAGGRTQVIINGSKRVRSYDLKTGELLWACGGQGPSAIPTPVADGRNVYAMTGFITNAVYAIPLASAGDITGEDDKIAWKTRKVGSPYVPSPLIDGEFLYFTAGNKGLLSCFDAATGEPIVDRQRLGGISNIYASPVGADGRIYLTSREGTTVVIPAGKFADAGDKKEVEILATNQLDERFDASAAIAGDELFLRGREHLYCISKD